MRTEHTRYYRIKPLKWKKTTANDYWQVWSSDSAYSIDRDRFKEGEPWTPWKVKWCFAEYYDEGERQVESLAEGKRWADDDNIKRLLPRLTEVHKLTY